MAILKVNEKEYSVSDGITILAALSEIGFLYDAPCGGNHKCGKCKIHVSGSVSDPAPEELRLLSDEERASGIRLACSCTLTGDACVSVEESKFEIQETSLGELNFSKDALPFSTEGFVDPVGIAVDIGTTTVVLTMFDLTDGRNIFTTSEINAQKVHGADVMSRIGFSVDGGGEILKMAIVDQINSMIKSSGIETGRIVHMTIAGNTTMELIAAGYSVDSLAAVPFEPESKLGFTIKASDIGYCLPRADVYFLPCCGGFFGGDAVAVMTYCDFEKGYKYMADIGTNGEMAICNDGRIYGCSTAAGPAFEGACIRFGTGSIAGAINSVDEHFNIKTIKNRPPCGICGSGLIDITAACLKNGLIDETGLIEDGEDFEDNDAIKIADGIYFTQADVREIQLAKSAIRAGTSVLQSMENGIPDSIYIAGGFGTAINLENAGYIGLLPVEYCKIANAVGNAALAGAQMVLLSSEMRAKAERISHDVEIIDLSVSPLFQDEYIDNMVFEND